MPKEAAYIRALKDFTRGPLELTDLIRFELEVYGGNDRAAAVMLGSIVEGSLEQFLRAKVRPSLNSDDKRLLFDFVSPLGNFASKTLLAYAFNLIGPETRDDLDLIRLLRNEFAHSRKSFGFTDADVGPVCAHLKSPDWPGAFIPHGYLNSVKPEDLATASDKANPKTRYLSACHVIAERLLDHTNTVGATGKRIFASCTAASVATAIPWKIRCTELWSMPPAIVA